MWTWLWQWHSGRHRVSFACYCFVAWKQFIELSKKSNGENWVKVCCFITTTHQPTTADAISPDLAPTYTLWSLKDSLHGQTFECYSGHKWPVWTARWKALHWLHKALECRWEKMHCALRGLCRTTIKWLCTWSTVSMFFSLHAEQPSYMQEILLGHHQKQQQQPYYCVYDWMLLSVSQCSNCQSM